MAKVLYIDDILIEDNLAKSIANSFQSWDSIRQAKATEWTEIQQYIFATDTSKTSNRKNPWSNKTTIPKLCQIRDNLYANYVAAMFPKRKWLFWQGDTEDDDTIDKTKMIESYMSWVIDHNEYYDEASKIVLDYIDYGNCFATVEWVDERVNAEGDRKDQVGYVGPRIRRISPLDIVFNPTAPNFKNSPKIVRTLVSLGEVKEMLLSPSTDPEKREENQKLYDYLKDIRETVRADARSNWKVKSAIYDMAGLGSYVDYLMSDMVEILTFYGDAYDPHSDTFLKNYQIVVADRHVVISKIPNPSYFGTAPIYHCGWRVRQDSLWAMGPLDNLVGMQYRIDHLENLKADAMDISTYPLFKVKGIVPDFEWQPGERIQIDSDGDVELLYPNHNLLSVNSEISVLEQKMEEMAGAPKEAMGFRTPGEKTKYEVQRQESAAGRIFNSKIVQIERGMFENLINAMLELSRRTLDEATIRVFDPEFKINDFVNLTAQDITGSGRIKPLAARHFAEQSDMVQNISNFFSSSVGADPEIKMHFSALKIAQVFENILNLDTENIVQPYIRLNEQAEAQRLSNTLQEQVGVESQTPTGLTPDDYDPV